MSKLAAKLPDAGELADRIRRGPTGECDIYGDGDIEDWTAVQMLRLRKSWAVAHREVDKAERTKTPIEPHAFRYHWGGKCWHWTPAQKRQIENEFPKLREAVAEEKKAR